MPEQQTVDSLCLIGKSDPMQQLYKMIGRVCNTNCAILLIGEKGSGKNTVARALHFYSYRSSTPFRILNGNEMRDSSDEELLGLKEGSHLNEGTYYLTEFIAVPLFMQYRLLAIQQSGKFKCAHRNRLEKHHFRFIVANDGNIGEQMQSGVLPEDVFYDWNFQPLYVPPLRDRKEDIPLIANHFLDLLSSESKTTRKELSPEAVELLLNHQWPGNLDELKLALRTALTNCKGSYIRAEHLTNLSESANEESEALVRLEMYLNSKLSPYIENLACSYQEGDLYRLLLPQMEKSLFQYALKRCRGNKNRAANLLGLHRNTLNKKLRKM